MITEEDLGSWMRWVRVSLDKDPDNKGVGRRGGGTDSYPILGPKRKKKGKRNSESLCKPYKRLTSMSQDVKKQKKKFPSQHFMWWYTL